MHELLYAGVELCTCPGCARNHRGLSGGTLDKAEPEFWFMTRIAMLAGVATACPIRAWLLQRGIKHPM